jgi:tellurite resistance protein
MSSAQAKISYDMSIDEKMNLLEIEQLKEPGSIPLKISSISSLPVTSFNELRSKIENKELLLNKFSTSYSSDHFKFFANTEQIRFGNILTMSLAIVPIVTLLLAVVYSFWWLMLVLVLPFLFSTLKSLYIDVILQAAFNSEKTFCFLYNSKLISLATPDFESVYWNDKSNNKTENSVAKESPQKVAFTEKKKTIRGILETREKYLAEEKPFVVVDLGTRKASMKPSDVQFVAMIMAFAWKHAGMSEEAALEYSVLTFVLKNDGTEKEKADADSTATSAFQWDFEQGLDLVEIKLYCGERIKDHLLNLPRVPMGEKKMPFESILLNAMVAMAGADEEISEEEFTYMLIAYRVVTKKEISDTDFANKVLQIVEKANASNEGLLDCLSTHRDQLTPQHKEMILQTLIMVSASDGQIDKDEAKVIGDVGSLLKIEISRFKEIVKEATEQATKIFK